MRGFKFLLAVVALLGGTETGEPPTLHQEEGLAAGAELASKLFSAHGA